MSRWSDKNAIYGWSSPVEYRDKDFEKNLIKEICELNGKLIFLIDIIDRIFFTDDWVKNGNSIDFGNFKISKSRKGSMPLKGEL